MKALIPKDSSGTRLFVLFNKIGSTPIAHNSLTIENKGWTLIPSKYIDFIDRDMQIDFRKEMNRIQKEMINVIESEKNTQSMLEDAFEGIGYGIKKN